MEFLISHSWILISPFLGPVLYWTTPEKTILQTIFARHIRSKTLPSLAECGEVISRYPELRQRTSETVKAWINNQSKKIQRGKMKS